MEGIRVLLVDDDADFRHSLRATLKSYAGIDIVGEAVDGLDALLRYESLRPELIVMDISMPRLGGIEATRSLKETGAQVKVLALTMHADEVMHRLMREAGADDLLLKTDDPDTIVDRIRTLTRAV